MNSSRFFAAALLLVAVLIGAFLRFDALGEPSYWLDEILGEVLTDGAVAQPWWHWVTGLDREHGPLYYATQLASRAAGSDEAAGRLPAALFGLATIPLIWLAARGRTLFACAVSALLLATSPLHVYYSREARPYALLMFLTAALLVAMLSKSRVVIVAAILLAMLYTSATAGPVIAAAAATSLLVLVFVDRKEWRVAATAAFMTLLVPLLYRAEPWTAAKRDFPPLDLKLASTLLHALTVSAFGADIRGHTAIALLAFAIIGAVALFRRDVRAAIVVTSMTVLPTLFALAPLWLSGHFFATRYIAPSLIGFVVLAGTGIAAIAEPLWGRPLAGRAVGRWPAILSRARPPAARPAGSRPHNGSAFPALLALAIVIATATQTWDTARREPFQKLDWRGIAATLRAHVRPGDVIAAAEPYSYLSLQHYLGERPPGVHFVLLDIVPVAERWTRSAPASWLITAGYGTEISHWMCSQPLLLASPIEGFRLHYAPSARAFLTDRGQPPEQRAAAASLGARGFTLEMGPDDDVVLGDGWASAEGSGRDAFRWAIGRRAALTFPRTGRRDRVIRFRAYPLTAASLPAQTLRISLNGAPAADLVLAPEWREYAVNARAALWREGMNTLTLDFARATSPASLDPRSQDQRELAASVDWIAIDDADAPPSRNDARDLPTLPAIRLAADHFLDARTAWRNTPTRFPAARLRRDAVERLLARLGYDPLTTWPQLARGDVRLDDVVETIAYGSCHDDATFVRHAFAVLLERAPGAEEEKSLRGLARVRIVGRIAKSDEFRARVLVK